MGEREYPAQGSSASSVNRFKLSLDLLNGPNAFGVSFEGRGREVHYGFSLRIFVS